MSVWSRLSGTAVRYTLLQLPEIALLTLVLVLIRKWVGLPGWLFGVVLGLWILKTIVLYPFVRRSYLPNPHRAGESMIGERGLVKITLDPEGYVSIRGEIWRAKLKDAEGEVHTGEAVRILEVKGLTLIVTPEGNDGG